MAIHKEYRWKGSCYTVYIYCGHLYTVLLSLSDNPKSSENTFPKDLPASGYSRFCLTTWRYQHQSAVVTAGRLFDTFLNFFDKVWRHATLSIILWFRSNFRSAGVRCLSFLGEKTELIYLLYSPFYTYLCTLVKICAKKGPNVGCTVKKRVFICLYLFNGVR